MPIKLFLSGGGGGFFVKGGPILVLIGVGIFPR